jgi:hypothetical protein
MWSMGPFRVPPACPQQQKQQHRAQEKRRASVLHTTPRTHLYNLERLYFNPWKETTAQYAYETRGEHTKTMHTMHYALDPNLLCIEKVILFLLVWMRRVRACVIIWRVRVMLCWFKLCLPEGRQQAAAGRIRFKTRIHQKGQMLPIHNGRSNFLKGFVFAHCGSNAE